jgi:hypothetical protein
MILGAAVNARRPLRRAALLLGALLAGGCSHAWDALDPSPSSAGTGGNAGAGVSAASSGAGGASASGAGVSTSVTSAASSAVATSSVASTSASGAGGSMTPGSIEYLASVSTCAGFNSTAMTLVDPAACEQSSGFAQMTIDADDTNLTAVLSAYLRFDLDGALAGKTIDAVKLRLVVTTASNANSDHSGEIWQVEPFAESDLAMALPAQVGVMAISADQGSVALGQTLEWALPASFVAPDAPVFLGIFTSSGNGVKYWTKNGPAPPRLIIDYH